jgi:hypothetical protein
MLLESRIVSRFPVSGKTLKGWCKNRILHHAHDHVFRHASYSTLKEQLARANHPASPTKRRKRLNRAKYSLAKCCEIQPNYARADETTTIRTAYIVRHPASYYTTGLSACQLPRFWHTNRPLVESCVGITADYRAPPQWRRDAYFTKRKSRCQQKNKISF